MREKVKLQCPSCGNSYDADAARFKLGRQTTCSRACSYKARATALERGQQHQCGCCGKGVYRSPAQAKSRHGGVFCSTKCAYSVRKRVVSRPYIRIANVDYAALSKKAWQTRRANPKPYPDAARKKAATQAIERIQKGGGVSQFEREVAKTFRALGFSISTSVAVRSSAGTFAHVFDIVLPVRRIIIECHGTYFHGGRWTWLQIDATQIKNLGYEQRKTALARSLGLDLRLLWEHQFKQDQRGACLAVVR